MYSKFPLAIQEPFFADCPAIRLAGVTPPCSFPCLAGGELAFPLIARQPLTRHC